MSAPDSSESVGFNRLPFVDRIDECRLICHPDVRELRDGEKACCVVLAKQPGAGKTYLGKECLRVALDNPPEPYTRRAWEARLPICTLHCEARRTDTLATVLMRLACYASERLDQLQTTPELKAKIENGNRCEVVKRTPSEANEILEAREVARAVYRLVARMPSLNISEETKKRFRSETKELANELIRKLHKKSLSEWAKIVDEIMADPVDASEISEWLSVEPAARCLAKACEKWNDLYTTELRPAALLIVVDEAQRVLPGADEEEVEKEKVREELKRIFDMVQPVFDAARFLWTGVNSAAVDLQMSGGDHETEFRVASIALPPLDSSQWTEALERAPSRVATNLLEEMIGKLKEKAAKEDVWGDIADEPDQTERDEEFKRRALAEMMSCTGGWPRKVREFLNDMDQTEWKWISEVFGNEKRKQRMENLTIQLLDRAYREPDVDVLDLMKTIDLKADRVFYELLHTSGMRLVRKSDNTPVIYVPKSTPEVAVGVRYTSSLRGVRLQHTIGSLLLQASLRKQTACIHAERGKYEAFTHDPAEEATINTLTHLAGFRGELKHVLPWLNSAPSEIGARRLAWGGLCAFRGLIVNEQGRLTCDDVPFNLEEHGAKKGRIKPSVFKDWLEGQTARDGGSFIPFLYVLGPRSTSGDVILVLKGLHIHMQVKNAANANFEKELIKMRAVASKEVTNIFVLVNYYDKTKKRPASFVEMSTLRKAAIEGVTREAGTDDPKREIGLTGIEEQCLVANLEDLWSERLEENVEDMIRRTPSRVSATRQAAASSELEDVEDQPKKKPRLTSTTR